MTLTSSKPTASPPTSLPSCAPVSTDPQDVDLTASTGFRGDIDGLRALAIVAVVLFHADVSGFSGGFVGVDVFFVISGFLITRNLLAERDRTGRIGLAAFWARRARRLVPALGLMMAVTGVAALFVLSPLEWSAASLDVATSATYVSNMRYAATANDYFAVGRTNLFLHTWSLSVEEQFYLVWPLVVAVAAGIGFGRHLLRRGRVQGVLVTIAFVSVMLCVYFTAAGSPWAFYGLATRAWQFAAAGLLATVVGVPVDLCRLRPRCGPMRWAVDPGVYGFVGLALIIGSVLIMDERTPYPGTAALVPTAGALLVLAAGAPANATVLGQALSRPMLQRLGRISYSWYLWHWPVIVVVAIVADSERPAVKLSAALAALGPATASYRLVEQPLRRSRSLIASTRRSLVVGVAITVAVGLLAVGVAQQGRIALREPLQAQVAAARADIDMEGACRRELRLPETCLLGADAAAATIVVVGDSHAAAWIPAYDAAIAGLSIRVVVRSHPGCPSADITIQVATIRDGAEACRTFRRRTAELIAELAPDAVVMANASFLGQILDANGRVPGRGEQIDIWRAALDAQVGRLRAAGITVALLANGPKLGFDPLVCIGRKGSVHRCSPSRSDALADVTPLVDAEVAVLAAPTADRSAVGPVVLRTDDLMCGPDVCPLVLDGVVVLYDFNHVTVSFARRQGPAMRRFLRQLVVLPRETSG